MSELATILVGILPILFTTLSSLITTAIVARSNNKLAQENSKLQVTLSVIEAQNKLDLSDRETDNKIKLEKAKAAKHDSEVALNAEKKDRILVHEGLKSFANNFKKE